MKKALIKASLKYWRARKAKAERGIKRNTSAAAMRKWKNVLAHANKVIARREAQLAALKPLRERAYLQATQKVGVMEQGSNNHGEAVEEIITYAGGAIGEPWCADFVIWCYGHAGSQVVKRGFPRAVRFMNVAGTSKTTKPRRGDIVRYTFDHTGLFVKDNGNGTITTIEGNTGASGAVSDSTTGGDGVYKKVRSKSLVSDYLHVSK